MFGVRCTWKKWSLLCSSWRRQLYSLTAPPAVSLWSNSSGMTGRNTHDFLSCLATVLPLLRIHPKGFEKIAIFWTKVLLLNWRKLLFGRPLGTGTIYTLDNTFIDLRSTVLRVLEQVRLVRKFALFKVSFFRENTFGGVKFTLPTYFKESIFSLGV